MCIPFFPCSFGSRKAGLSRPLALYKSHYDLKRDSFQVMPAEAAKEFVSMERRTNAGTAVCEQLAGDAPQPGSAAHHRSCSQRAQQPRSLCAQRPGSSRTAVAHGLAACPPSVNLAEVWGRLPVQHSSLGARVHGKQVRPSSLL